MPAPLKTMLTPEESVTLDELRMAIGLNHRIRDRAHMLLLNANGWSVASIADIFKCHQHTVRAALKRWQAEKGCMVCGRRVGVVRNQLGSRQTGVPRAMLGGRRADL